MLAAITNYYNPKNRPEKWENFKIFRERLQGIPLYVVEAAFGDQPFSLPPGENIIHVRCKDVIWQQYTLVNLGILRLPDKFDKAVWIDADIVFEEPDWHERMDDLLDQYKIVQSYSTVCMLSKGHGPGTEENVRVSATRRAFEREKEGFRGPKRVDLSSCYPTGFSWGVQREVVEKHRIYDYWITGSCDSAFIIAIWGDWDNRFMERVNERMTQHYREWALPFHEYINGSTYYLDTQIYHLWHGYRNYRKRWNCIQDMDPYKDIEIGRNGCLQWCSDKPEMHHRCEMMCKEYELDFRMYL